jgi:multicomponent Na+:H+ antiporter subunit D
MLALTLAIPWFGATVLLLADGRRRAAGWAAVAVMVSTLVATGVVGAHVLDDGPLVTVAGGWPAGVGIVLRADALGVLFAALSQVALLTALIYEVTGGVRSRTFPALVLFMGLGLTGLCLTGDVFNFYVFFEISMIAAYVLTGYGEGTRQLRAAAIFAVVNLLGSVLFLIAIAALYHITGRLDMPGVTARVPIVQENPALLTATILFVAFGIKLGLFPFHFWLPAVYAGTRPAVAAMLSGALANIGTYGLIRFGAGILPRELSEGAPALLILGTASVLYGALQAIGRRDPSEVLAYSSIGQVGYVLLALSFGGQVGLAAAIVFSVVNSLNKTLLFLAVELRGRLVTAAVAVGAFSVCGVPPAAGFFGKAALLRAAIEEASAFAVALLFAGGALSFVYMFQVFGRSYLAPPEDESPRRHGLIGRRLTVGAMALSILLLGIWPQPLLEAGTRAAQALPSITGGAP